MIPKVILTGKAGGTVIVIKSMNFWNNSIKSEYEWTMIISAMNAAKARQKRKNKYLVDYLWKIFSCSFGNKMILTNWPFVVTKLVLTTQTGIPYFYRNDSKTAIFFLSLTWMMVVPSKTKAFLSMGVALFAILSKVSAFLTIGTDSPVRAHSLISALP